MQALVAALVGFLTALPQIMTFAQEFMKWLNKVSGNDPVGFLMKSADAFKSLNQAKTEEEHAQAAKDLSDLIRALPR